MPNTKSAIRKVRRVKVKLKSTGYGKVSIKTLLKIWKLFSKAKIKQNQKNIFKISINLMQVAKSGVIKKNCIKKISRTSKKLISL